MLIVEDGTGLKNANAYISIKEFEKFAELNGILIDDVETDQLSVFIIRATNYVDSMETRFVGKRLLPTQGLAFPRTNACSYQSFNHLSDLRSLKMAVCYAVEAQCLGNSLLPVQYTSDNFITKEEIDGAIKVQYDERSLNLIGRFPMVERFLSVYMNNNFGQVRVSR